ncbi:restriction endonuclease subunit S [Acinetobacter johnsonii]|uniref:restriction endonuclease subunit S n=1 Tax=Acinetobacter johnsonii TaxID=40214 RepID=UPI003AF6F6CA
MAKYQKYAEYKYSGVGWLGQIPSHWIASKIGFHASKIGSGKTPRGGAEIYEDEGVLFLRSQNIYNDGLKIDNCESVYITQTIHEDMSTSKVHSGDILLNITGGSIGRSCLVPPNFTEANVNQHVCIIRVRDHLNEFLALVIKADLIQAQIRLIQTGGNREGLNFEQIAKFIFMLPPPEEQKLIISFLDHETAKIDTLIAKQEKLIELLKEKRQAVISHAVTKGLNPNVPMKDSGVEWLGKVPGHWAVSKLKHFVNVVDCKHITAEFFDEGIPLASIGEVKGWKVNLAKAKLTNEKYYQELIDGNRKPQIGDIIYTRNATVGEAAIVHEELPKFALGQDVCLIHIVQKLSPKFLLHFLKSEIIKIQLNSAMVGSTFKRINVDDIRNYVVVIPPIEDQQSILNDLNKKIDKYDSLISLANSQIKFMQERRTVLISAAVTGKIDVRNWQHPNQKNNSNTELSA